MDNELILDAVSELLREKFADLDRRLAAVENRPGPDLSPLEQRIADADYRATSAFDATADLVAELERRLAAVEDRPEPDLSPLEQRLAAVEGRPEPDLSPLEQRLAAVEDRPEPDLSPLEQRLAAVEGRPEPDLSPLEQRLAAVEGRPEPDLSPLEQRVAAVEGRPEPDLSPLEKRVAAVEGRFEQGLSLLKQGLNLTQERLTTVENRPEPDLSPLEQRIERTQDELWDRFSRSYQNVEQWARGGSEYKPEACVRHNGGLWQARTRTLQEPGKGDDWVLIADGIHSFEPVVRETGEVAFTIKMASGRETQTDTSFQLPIPKPQGVYREDREYGQYDAVVKDNHTFMAVVKEPGPLFEDPKQWVCIGHRGKAGRAGKDAPQLDEIKRGIVPDLYAELPGLVAVAVEGLNR